MSGRLRPIILLSCALAFGLPAAAERVDYPKILIIHSYSPESKWTESQNRGILQEIGKLGRDTIIYSEYLDWKRFPSEDHIRLMLEVFKDKYPSKKIDVIITTDDRALEFALENRKRIFSDAPIVFSGVYQDRAKKITAEETRVTGAYEDFDIDIAIRTALKINPDTDSAYIINEQTESGLQTEKRLIEAFARVAPGMPVNSLREKGIDEIEAFVPFLGRNSLLMAGSFSIEKNGQVFPSDILANRISAASSVPLYTLFDQLFGTGALGGAMMSGDHHGETAGALAVRFLNGEAFETLTPIMKTELVTIFDYAAAKRYKIPLGGFPRDAAFINRDPPFFVRYKVASLIISAIFAVMLITMLFLVLLNRKTRSLALTDQLTGLPNRTAILKIAERMIHTTERWNKCGIIFIDIDNFKYINDMFGHDTGDKVLVFAANAIQDILGERMCLSRFGGDEFLIILENTSYDAIDSFAQELQGVLGKNAAIEGKELFMTVSAGIAVYPDHGLHFRELYKNADAAMYKAKLAGKTRYIFYNDSMYQELKKRMSLTGDLRQAIRNGELFLDFQPQISLKTGLITGAAALLRWNHPKDGVIAPGDFIPVAEEMGLIAELGRFALRSATRLIKECATKGHSDFTVTINVSVKQLSKDFAGDFLGIIESEGIPAGRFVFEITESIPIESTTEIAEWIKPLRDAGCHLSIHDFARGFFSFTNLRKLPVDGIKLDKAFIDDALKDDYARIAVTAIIAICHNWSLEVTASGVETREQLQFLMNSGCDRVQGHYFSRAESPERFQDMIDRRFLVNTVSTGTGIL